MRLGGSSHACRRCPIMSIAKGAMRSVKNYTKGYSDMQVKVREATSNDPYGPEGALMAQIAQATHDPSYFSEITDMIDRRLNDSGKNWRHVYKALVLLDYCLHAGSEAVVKYARDNLFVVKTLREFVYVDDDGRDQGVNVRNKAKVITGLLLDDERLRAERTGKAGLSSRLEEESTAALGGSGRMSPRPSSGRSKNSAVATRRNQEDDELLRALEESKRTAEDDERRRRSKLGGLVAFSSGISSDSRPRADSDDDLRCAIELSKREADERERKTVRSNELILLGDDAGPSVGYMGAMIPAGPSANNPFASMTSTGVGSSLTAYGGVDPNVVDPFALMTLGTLSNAVATSQTTTYSGLTMPMPPQQVQSGTPGALDMQPYSRRQQLIVAGGNNNPFGSTNSSFVGDNQQLLIDLGASDAPFPQAPSRNPFHQSSASDWKRTW